jgi:hypothetical protein
LAEAKKPVLSKLVRLALSTAVALLAGCGPAPDAKEPEPQAAPRAGEYEITSASPPYVPPSEYDEPVRAPRKPSGKGESKCGYQPLCIGSNSGPCTTDSQGCVHCTCSK